LRTVSTIPGETQLTVIPAAANSCANARGEAAKRCLGGHDVGAHRRPGVRSHAADIDYSARLAGAQQRQRRLGAVESAVDAHGLRFAPIGVAQVGEGNFKAHRCVVDHDVEALIASRDRGDHRIDFDALRDVGRDQHGISAALRDFVDDRLTFGAARRTFTATFAPASARLSAMARPMLRPEPVTSATLPLSGVLSMAMLTPATRRE
jgi:hypothetical protein